MIEEKSQGLPVEEAVLESLFLEKYPLMYNVAFQLLRNRDDAEDAVQDAFIKWWKNRMYWKNDIHAKANCILVVKNICIDKLRMSRFTKDLLPELEEQIGDDSYTPLRKILRAELYNDVHKALEQLPPARKEVISLTMLEDLSLEKVAARMGKTYDATKALKHEAWKQLRGILIDQYHLSPELLQLVWLYWFLRE
ncbi:MAG: RNA polymerase sigma factor [Niastella sp.]|nr:RNA polymerase sigma factor [Niastella sp.]